MLFQYHVDGSQKDIYDKKALDYAIQGGHQSIRKLFCEKESCSSDLVLYCVYVRFENSNFYQKIIYDQNEMDYDSLLDDLLLKKCRFDNEMQWMSCA